MNNLMRVISLICFTLLVYFLVPSLTYAQYCGGSVTCCAYYETVYTPNNCSRTCNPSSPGCVRCTGSTRECGSYAGSGACSTWGAGGGGGTCFDNCNGTIESGGCSSYNPPPAPPPPPPSNPPPPPPPGCEETNTCPEDPEEPPQPGYVCDQNLGCISAPAGGVDFNYCQSTCATNPGDTPTPAGHSSCPDVQNSATEDITYPGQTRTWSTWAAPPGSTPAQRLTNESPVAMIQRSYTSPGDMLTISYVWQEIEGQASSFYIYDAHDHTFFFYAAPDKPPVIFARDQAVVENALEAGYTQITNIANTPASIAAAEAVEKRVYKLSDWDEEGDIHPWHDGVGPAAVSHAPFGKSYYQVPILNCASIFNASGHKHYYSTNLTALDNDRGYCFRRQRLRHNNNEVTWYNTDTESNYTHAAGNYLSLEEDLDATVNDHIFGYDNSGDRIWPITSALVGPRWSYFDNFAWAFMETKGEYLQRPEDQNADFTPAYMRNAVMQIPTKVFEREGEHDLFVFIGMGMGGEPVPDENSDQGCMLSQDFNADVYIHAKPVTEPPACEGFQVYDSAGVPTDQIRLGQQYTVRSKGRLESQIYSLYNSNFVAGFNATDTSQGNVAGWTATSDITYFKSVRCDIDNEECAPDSGDNRMLTVVEVGGVANGQSTETAYVESPYFETNSDISGKTVTVEFWAKTDMPNPVVVSKMEVQRAPYTLPEAPYNQVSDASDKVRLNFPGSTIGSSSYNFVVDEEWDKFTGTVTFPTTHPAGSKSTKLKLILRASGQGGEIHYDNFTIIGSHKPTVDFRMVPASAQCSQSIPSDTNSFLPTGQFVGTFNMSPSNPNGRYDNITPGTYYMFARMQDPASGITYFGNPDPAMSCPGVNPDLWDNSIADTCMKELELLTCNENTPPTPSFIPYPIPGGGQGLSYIKGSTSAVSYMPQGGGSPQITQMPVLGTSTATYRLPLRITIPSNQAANVTAIEYQLYKMDHNGGNLGPVGSQVTIPTDGVENTFDIEIVPSKALTNQFIIQIQTINDNSCSEANGLVSSTLEGRIIMMGSARGTVINIPKEDADDFNCEETYVSGVAAKSSGYSIASELTAQLAALGETDISGDNYVDFINPPYANLGSGISSSFLTPFNLDNSGGSTGWKNRIRAAQLTLPPINSQDSYMCLDCNQTGGIKNICTFPPHSSDLDFFSNNSFNQANFFITSANIVFDTSWWQNRGGLVGSLGSMDSDIPILNGAVSWNCLQNNQVCQPYLAARDMSMAAGENDSDQDNSAGVALTNSTELDAQGYISQNPGGPNATQANTAIVQEDYEYFRKLFKNDVVDYNPSHPTLDFREQVVSSATLYTSENDTNLHVIETTGDLSFGSPTTWNVSSGQKLIIFVNGNLTISGSTNQRIIDVANDSYLMFIVSGDITFASGLGHSGDTNYNVTSSIVEGVFLANDDIIVASRNNAPDSKPNDYKFNAEGSFIALNQTPGDNAEGFDLQRQYEEEGNSLSLEKNSYAPIDMFVFRPDFVINAPNIINRPYLSWKETN